MKSVEFVIDLLHKIEVHAYTQQLLVEIVFDYTGFSFMLTSYYQFVVFCASFFRVIINTAYISMLPFIWEFWIILPFLGWLYFWYHYIRTLKYIIWLKGLKNKILSSTFIVHVWPKWRVVIYQYTSYYTSYTKIFKNYINLHYPSLGSVVKVSSENKWKILTPSARDLLDSWNKFPLKNVNWHRLLPLAKIVEFTYTIFVYMPYAFKFGNRKQSYFRNYFNAKKRYNNWIWKWRK